MAEHVGVSRQAVSRWESGSAKPDADKIIILCDLFGVSADYLLRDVAGGMDVVVSASSKRITRPWFAWAAAAFGGVILFILGILSSVNRIYVEPVHHISSDGRVHIQQSGYYTGFSEYVNGLGLDWLVWLAGIALVLGGGYLLFRWYHRLWKETFEE